LNLAAFFLNNRNYSGIQLKLIVETTKATAYGNGRGLFGNRLWEWKRTVGASAQAGYNKL